MFSKLEFQNLLIYENISNFVQVQGQENLQTQQLILIYTEVYITCMLGRTYFVERSIHLIEEHWLLII